MSAMGGRTLGVALFLMVRIVGLLGGVALLAVVSRTLGPADLGVFATSIAFAATLSGVADLGFSSVALRQTVREPDHASYYVGFAARARFLVGSAMALVVVALLVLVPAWSTWHSKWAFVIACLGVPAGFFQVYFAYLQRMGRFLLSSLLALSQTLLWFTSVVILTQAKAQLEWYVALQTATPIVVTVVAYILVRTSHDYRESTRRPGSISPGRLLAESSAVGAASVASSVYYRLNSILVLVVAGPVQAGYYGIASRSLDQASILPNTLGSAYAPRINQAFAVGRDQVLAESRRYADMLTILSVPPAVIVTSYPTSLVGLLFGAQYVSAAASVVVLAFVFLLICLGWALTAAVISQGKSLQQAIVGGLAIPIAAGSGFGLSSQFGAVGAAVAALVTEVAVCIGLLIVLGRHSVRIIPGWRLVSLSVTGYAVVGLVSLMPLSDVVEMVITIPIYVTALFMFRLIKKRDLLIPRL